MPKSPLILALIAALGLSSAVAAHDKHDKANDITRTYDFTGFNALSIGGVYDMDVIVGEDYGITLSGSEKDMRKVTVKKSGKTLILDWKDGRTKSRNTHGIEATITLPALTRLNVSGVGDFDVEGIKAKDFKVDIEGVGEVTLKGTCDSLTASLEGVGELDAEDLKCEDVDIDLSGIGSASVYANDRLSATASGIGGIDVYGKPDVVQRNGGSLSQVKIK